MLLPKQWAIVTGGVPLEHIPWLSAFADVSHLLVDPLEGDGRYQ